MSGSLHSALRDPRFLEALSKLLDTFTPSHEGSTTTSSSSSLELENKDLKRQLAALQQQNHELLQRLERLEHSLQGRDGFAVTNRPQSAQQSKDTPVSTRLPNKKLGTNPSKHASYAAALLNAPTPLFPLEGHVKTMVKIANADVIYSTEHYRADLLGAPQITNKLENGFDFSALKAMGAKHLMIISRNLDDTINVFRKGTAQGSPFQYITALLLAPRRLTLDATLATVADAFGVQPHTITSGFPVECNIRPERGEWAGVEPDQKVMPRTPTVLLTWILSKLPTQTAPRSEPCPTTAPSCFDKFSKIVICIRCKAVDPKELEKPILDVRKWAKRICAEALSPIGVKQIPMDVGTKGDIIEVIATIPENKLQQALQQSGRAAGIFIREFIKGDTRLVQAQIVRVVATQSHTQIWELMSKYGWFGGLTGDTDNPHKHGIRVLRSRELTPQERQDVFTAVGQPMISKSVVIRVIGYPEGFGLEEYAEERQKAATAAGLGHITACHFVRGTRDGCIFDITVDGVPAQWQGFQVLSADTRTPDIVWRRLERFTKPHTFQRVAPRQPMPPSMLAPVQTHLPPDPEPQASPLKLSTTADLMETSTPAKVAGGDGGNA